MRRILYIYLLFLLSALPAHAQMDCGYFEVPNTWCWQIGQTTGDITDVPTAQDRLDVWTNQKMAGSDALMADLGAYVRFGFMNSAQAWSPLHCVSTNADPLRTVTLYDDGEGIMAGAGWNILRMDNDCIPPHQSDGLAVFINTDDPDWIWEFYKIVRIDNGGGNISWTANSIHKYARTRAAADANSSPYDGRGMGVEPVYTAFSGASGACPASAIYSQGTVRKAELDAGRITHALAWVMGTERVDPHYKIYPCATVGTTVYPVPPGLASRTAAPVFGERLQLNPSINIDALDIGAHAKIVLKATQEYGYIPSDSTDLGMYFFPTNDAQSQDGYDYRIDGSSFANTNVFNAWLYANSHWIPCQNAFANECNGGDPPAGFPGSDVITITSTNLDSGVVSTAYSDTLTSTGGTGAKTWAVASGSLPASLSLAASTGVISGTPSAAAVSTFTVSITDSTSPTPLTDTSGTLTITITAAPVSATSADDPPNVNAVGFNYLAGTLDITDATLNSGTHLSRGTPFTAPITFDSDLIDADDRIHFYWREGETGLVRFAGSIFNASSLSIDPLALGIPATQCLQIGVFREEAGFMWGDWSQCLTVFGRYK